MNYLICSKTRFDPTVIWHGTILMGDQENSACIMVETQQIFNIAFFFFTTHANWKILKFYFLSVSAISKCTVVLPWHSKYITHKLILKLLIFGFLFTNFLVLCSCSCCCSILVYVRKQHTEWADEKFQTD